MKKITDEFYVNVFFRYFAVLITKILVKTPVTPNNISLFVIIVSFIVSTLLISAIKPHVYLSIPLLIVIIILMMVDGSLARAKNITSNFGIWINRISERLSYLMIGISFSWYIYKITSDYFIAFISLIAFIIKENIGILRAFTILSSPSADKTIFSNSINNKNKIIKFCIRLFTYVGNYYILFICLGIIFDANQIIIYFMFFYGLLSYLLALLIIGRKLYLTKNI